jgi:CHAD domain-containing protein
VEALLRAAGAADGDGRPKLFQVLGIEPVAPPRPPLERPAQRLAAVLAEQYAAIMANDPGTRLGADPEHLHRHRVAVRRLRAMLRAAGAMLDPTWTQELRDELGLLGRMLGPVRDLDVLIEHLTGSAATLGDPDVASAEPLLHQLGAERELARKVLLQALDSDRYLELLDRIKAAGEAPAVVDPYCALPELAEREFRKLARDARRIRPRSSDAELHELRIRGKRMRYAAELADPGGSRRWARLLIRARQLQDLLGAHQDAFTAEERLRDLAARSTDTAAHLAAGRLIERERARRAAARAAYPRVWERLERAAGRALA